MNIFTKTAIAAAALSVASAASAASISGSTDFRVTLPEILVLYHWDDAHLTLTDVTTTPDNDSDLREISDETTRDLSIDLQQTSAVFQGNDVKTPSPITNFDSGVVNVTLKNSWAVRSLSTGDVTLALTNPNSTLKNVTDNNVTIETKNAVLASAATGVTGSDSVSMTIPSGWEPVMGDIKFDLDLTGANYSGEYNTRGNAGKATTNDEATDTFLLTLTGKAQ
ncbi:hypothetical protein [Psychrobacter lutiphocae]|uniref:hypothetical protein n=1 Tax=Psychrobacter lutiphocae TaxID=540500 RepID=UPI0003776D68|nr:hypothetical protein [Psychrobacter lutiphocae]